MGVVVAGGARRAPLAASRLPVVTFVAACAGLLASAPSVARAQAQDNEFDKGGDDAIAADPDAWAKFCAGEGKAMGALVGMVMKASKGKADGKAVTALLNAKRP